MAEYDLLYLQYKRKKRISFFLQVIFLLVGALLIGSFAILFSNSPKDADALISPIVSFNQEKKSDSDYSFLYANKAILIYKEKSADKQTISIVTRSTNLTTEVITGKRLGFGGFISDNIFYVYQDNEGLGKFTVYTYDMVQKINTPFISFLGPKEIAENELDNLISISPDKLTVAITHSTGIVLYDLKTTHEITILENGSDVYYRNPKWVSNSSLIAYQKAIGVSTPLLVNKSGAIQSVFPANLTSLSPSSQGLPLSGVSNEGLHVIEPKKTTTTLESDKNTQFTQAAWLDEDNIIVLGNVSGLPSILKTDKTGKKVVSLKEFLTQTNLSNLIVDPEDGGIYFLAVTKSPQSVNTQFFKFEEKDEKPVSFYTINKNL